MELGLRHGTAVVCDDDAMVRRIVTAVLTRCGYPSVSTTPSGVEAVRLAAELQPEVIVLDLQLDGESGLDALPLLRAAAPGTPVIVYSGSRHDKPHAMAAGAFAVIDKISISNASELERTIEALRAPAPA